MAEIISFPDCKERNEREIRADIAAFLIQNAFAPERAERLSREIIEEFREFKQFLAETKFEFDTKTDGEKRLCHEVAAAAGNQAAGAWLQQRLLKTLRSRQPSAPI